MALTSDIDDYRDAHIWVLPVVPGYVHVQPIARLWPIWDASEHSFLHQEEYHHLHHHRKVITCHLDNVNPVMGKGYLDNEKWWLVNTQPKLHVEFGLVFVWNFGGCC